MLILVACESSAITREAFAERGHEVWSCDLKPSEIPGLHYQGDVRDLDLAQFDMVIAYPPCTYLTVAGARWWLGREMEQWKALTFVQYFMEAPVEKLAIENPIGRISTAIRKPDQTIQPWMFGYEERKPICLWLKGLPRLVPTHRIRSDKSYIHLAGGKNRSEFRSRTYPLIAKAMADQWG